MLDLIVDTSRSGARLGIFGENVSVEICDMSLRGESLSLAFSRMLSENKISLESITRVLVLRGPGSFTGLRTGIAFCEGLCFSGKRKLYGVSTLKALTLYGNKEYTLVLMRARPGFWYFRDASAKKDFLTEKECFWSTEQVVYSLKNTLATCAVLDSNALAEDSFAEIFKEKNIKTIQESEGSLLRFQEAFNWSEPSLVQEANYIQPSYAEQ